MKNLCKRIKKLEAICTPVFSIHLVWTILLFLNVACSDSSPTCGAPSAAKCSAGSYCLERSTDCVETPIPEPNAGYSVYALLHGPDGAVVTDQSDFTYAWTIDDPSVATLEPFDACILGIRSPCPFGHTAIKGDKVGATTIRVAVTQTSSQEVVAQTSYALTITP